MGRFVIVALGVALAGCMDPATMIASNLAQAAVVTGIEYAEAHRPSAEQAWQADRLERLRERARAGEPHAQYRLAVHYASQRDRRAAAWMCRAARGGLARARLQLGHWYNEDRLREDQWPFLDLAPDDREARRWYGLAAAAGEPAATVFRDQVAVRLRRGHRMPGPAPPPAACAGAPPLQASDEAEAAR